MDNKKVCNVKMEFTREKMISILETTREYLETLTENELIELGIEQGLWGYK